MLLAEISKFEDTYLLPYNNTNFNSANINIICINLFNLVVKNESIQFGLQFKLFMKYVHRDFFVMIIERYFNMFYKLFYWMSFTRYKKRNFYYDINHYLFLISLQCIFYSATFNRVTCNFSNNCNFTRRNTKKK